MKKDSGIREATRIINSHLESYFEKKSKTPFINLFKATYYSLFPGGKRIRPLLCFGTAEALGYPHEKALPVAGSVEMIHTFSLIHDDLPALDNDDERRGKATTHKVFGDALAILTGDALLSEAFFHLVEQGREAGLKEGNIVSSLKELAHATGMQGLIGGEAYDIELTGKEVSNPQIELCYIHKTGALIRGCFSATAQLLEAPQKALGPLVHCGEALGVLFQIVDDLLDAKEPIKKDNKKVSILNLLTLSEAQKRIGELERQSLEMLEPFGEKGYFLRQLVKLIAEREK